LTIQFQICGGPGKSAGENGKPSVKGNFLSLIHEFYFTHFDSFVLAATSRKNFWETRILGYRQWKLPPLLLHLHQLFTFMQSKHLPLTMTG
jgi:hypothetical protein